MITPSRTATRAIRALALRPGRTALVLIGVVVVGVLAGCGGNGGGGITPASVKQAYANELRPNSVAHIIYGIDPDQQPESSADNTSVLRSLPDNRYELSVTNTSDTGFINEFSWLPPGGMEVVHVLRSTTGHCALSGTATWNPLAPAGNDGAVNSSAREIVCDVVLAPPKCSCRPGETMTVDFTARYSAQGGRTSVATRRVGPAGRFVPLATPRIQFGIVNGWVEVDSMTPVPYKIPSYVGGESPQEDLPLCGRGQQPQRSAKLSCVSATPASG